MDGDDGGRKPVSQDQYDQFVFVQMARPGTYDMATERSDEVVQNMLRMRDDGDHPSVVSGSSRLLPPGGDPGSSWRRQLDRVEEDAWNNESYVAI